MAQKTGSVIHSDPEILGGTPVFVGTRVPLKNLFDYLEGGQPLDVFLDDFPSVSREHAVAALEEAKEALIQHVAAPDPLLTEAQRQEIQRRSEAHCGNPDDSSSLDEALERIERSLQ